MTQNQIRYLEAQETARANLAKEQENLRSNLAKEQENYRSNIAKERENYRSNAAKEQELNRSNLEAERLNREKLAYDRYGNNLPATILRTITAEGSGDGITSSGEKALSNTTKKFWNTVDKIGSSITSIFGYKEPTPEQKEQYKEWTNKYDNMSYGELDAYFKQNSSNLDNNEKKYIKAILQKKRNR